MTTFRRSAASLVCAVVLAGCSGSSDPGSSSVKQATTTEHPAGLSAGAAEVPSSTRVAPTTTVPLAPTQQEAVDLLAVLAPIVPIPEDARGCVAEKLAKDPSLMKELRTSDAKSGPPDGVMDLGAECMNELHAVPAFLDGLDETVDGGLSEKQRSCVERGYRSLDPEVVEALVADAQGAGRGTGKTSEVGAMLRKCGVKVGG